MGRGLWMAVPNVMDADVERVAWPVKDGGVASRHLMPIEDQHRATVARQERCCGQSSRPCSHDDDIEGVTLQRTVTLRRKALRRRGRASG